MRAKEFLSIKKVGFNSVKVNEGYPSVRDYVLARTMAYRDLIGRHYTPASSTGAAVTDIMQYTTYLGESENSDVKVFINTINNTGIKLEQVKVGQKISLLEFITNLRDQIFTVSGYVYPREVERIDHLPGGIQLTFTDGYSYPKYAQPMYEGVNPINTAIYTSANDLVSSYAFILLAKPDNWKIDLGGVTESEKLRMHTESYYASPARILNEGARIAHAEDLIFFEGSAGALRAIQSLASLVNDRSSLSLKFDGKPALVFGRNEQGEFILTDKSGFTAKGYNGLYRTPKEFIEQKRSKGTDEGYLNQINQIWPIVQSAVPKSFRGFVLGDVLWFPGAMTDNGRKYIFTPNTVTYEVDKNSDLGRRVKQSKAGMAVHTFYNSPGAEGVPFTSTNGLNINGELCIIGPETKNEAPLQQDKKKIKEVQGLIKKAAKNIDSFLDESTLASLRMAGLPEILYTFVNAQTKMRDLTSLAAKFLLWVQSNPKISKAMVQKVKDYVAANQQGLTDIFTIFEITTELKLDIIHQLDMHEGPITSHIAGVRGGEGYVQASPDGTIKLVNRVGFTAANAERNQ